MLDRLGFGVSNCDASKQFLLKALAPLGAAAVMEGEHGLGIGIGGKPALWIFQSNDRPAPLHLVVCFTLGST